MATVLPAGLMRATGNEELLKTWMVRNVKLGRSAGVRKTDRRQLSPPKNRRTVRALDRRVERSGWFEAFEFHCEVNQNRAVVLPQSLDQYH